MKPFIVTATLAVALGLGYSGKADAQIIYGFSTPTMNGTMTGGSVLMPSGPGMFNTFSSPFRGVMVQPSIGPSFPSPFGFNRFNSFGFNNGFFLPNTFGNPFFGSPFGGFNHPTFFM